MNWDSWEIYVKDSRPILSYRKRHHTDDVYGVECLPGRTVEYFDLVMVSLTAFFSVGIF
jgi:hypothetical protein